MRQFRKKKNNYVFNKISFSENKKFYLIEGLKFDNEKFKSKKNLVLTFNKDEKNNDFLIIFEKKMKIKAKI